MDVNGILKRLKGELFLVDQAIFALEQLALGSKRRRGRPPAWMNRPEDVNGRASRRDRPMRSRAQ